MKQSKCLESLFFNSIRATNKHRIRPKVSVDIVIKFVIILIDGSLCSAQTDFVCITQATVRFDFSPRKRLEPIFEFR